MALYFSLNAVPELRSLTSDQRRSLVANCASQVAADPQVRATQLVCSSMAGAGAVLGALAGRSSGATFAVGIAFGALVGGAIGGVLYGVVLANCARPHLRAVLRRES